MPPRGTIVCFLCKGIVSYKNKDSAKFEKHMNNEHMAYFGIEYLLAGCTMSEEERLAVKDVIKDRIEPDSESDQNTTLEEDADEVKPKKAVTMADEAKLKKAVKIADEVKPKKAIKEAEIKAARFQCSDCPISFTMANNLEEHVARKHPNKKRTKSKDILDAIDRKNAIDGEFSKTMKSFKTAGESLKKTSIATITPKSTSKPSLEKVVKGLSVKKMNSLDVSIKKDGEEVEVKRKNLTSTTPVPKKKTVAVKKKGDTSVVVAGPDQTAGDGTVCPICSKEFPKNGPMRRHFEDIHQPGEFPCSGCQKMFTSKNKMSSHYSRHCNPNNPNSSKRRTL